MRRVPSLVVAALLIASAAAVVPTAAVAQETTTTDGGTTTTAGATTTTTASATTTTTADDVADDNATDDNETVSPGARLGGVVGMQQAHLQGEVDGRAFGLAVAAAHSNNSKVTVVAEQYGDLRQRLRNLTERKRDLQRAHANGSISDAQFHAEMAELHARTQSVRQLANETENATHGLPAEKLRARGINATAIQRLKHNASELTGPQVAAIARSIGGRAVGRPKRAGPTGNRTRGPPGNRTRGPPNGTQGPPDGATTGQSANDGVPGQANRAGNATNATRGSNGAAPGHDTTVAAGSASGGDTGRANGGGNSGNGNGGNDRPGNANANANTDASLDAAFGMVGRVLPDWLV
ncbi:MAG: hypothetical protein ABEI96_03955 [Haloarculaceae archaeon]